MNTRVRTQIVEPATQPATRGGGEDPEQHELRERGAALLAAADDAISRALSNDSAEFLAQNRQAGGE